MSEIVSIAHKSLIALRRLTFFWKCYKAACAKPRQHKAFIMGHVLLLAGFIMGLLAHHDAEHYTGLAGTALLIHHAWTAEA